MMKISYWLVFQYVWFSIGAKMNLCGPGRLKVIKVVMGLKQGKGLVGNMR
jgi:hypothetical protein